MSIPSFPIRSGHLGSGKQNIGSCGVGPFNGRCYVRDEGFHKTLWITDGLSMFWVVLPRMSRRKCPTCGSINAADQKWCTDCGAFLWNDNFLDPSISRPIYRISAFGNNNGKFPKDFALPEEAIRVVESKGVDAVTSEDLLPLGLDIVPMESRKYRPLRGYYVAGLRG